MGMIWFRETFEIHVENPGYGELYLASNDQEGGGRTLAGDQLGRLLTAFTHYALTGARPETDANLIPANVTLDEARETLTVVQQAVILASAGTDRFERIYPDGEASPAPPLCESCSHGTDFSAVETHSEWCDEYGHTPFGFPAVTSWEQAQAWHKDRSDRWEWQQRVAQLYGDGRR